MTEQGGSYELDRDGAARAVAILSLHEERFLVGLREDPESTLWNYGFALSPREMELIRQTFGTPQEPGMSDEEIRRSLEEGEHLERRIWPW